MARARRAWAVGFVVATAIAPAAWSQDADALIAQGVARRLDNDDEAALRLFRQAWELRHSGRALAQIALAEQALGRWVDAEAHLDEALRPPQEGWIHHNRRALQAELASIRRHVGRLDLTANVPGAEVLVGDRRVGTLPLADGLRVAAGPVTFTVRAAGYTPVTRTVTVAPRAPQRESVTLEREPAPPPAPPTLAASPPRPGPPPGAAVAGANAPSRAGVRRYVGYGFLGAGAAALVVSGVFVGINASTAAAATGATSTADEPYGAWARFQANENYDRRLPGSRVCDLARVRADADAAQVRELCAGLSTSATVALATGIVGGALAVTGVVLVATSRSPAAPPPRWSAVPWLAPGVGGVSVAGAF